MNVDMNQTATQAPFQDMNMTQLFSYLLQEQQQNRQEQQQNRAQIEALTVELMKARHVNVDEQKSSTSVNLKPKLPPEFSGSKKKDKINPIEWLFLVEEYLKLQKSEGGNEAVSFAGTLLTEEAASWWVSFRPENPNLTWIAFKEALSKEFQDVNECRNARDALMSLRQDSKSVETYASEFRAIIRKLPKMDVGDRIYFFINGLANASTRREVEIRKCQTLDEAVQVAHSADNARSPDPLPRADIQRGNTGEPMDVDLNAFRPWSTPRRSSVRRPLLSQREREELSRNNGCFYCRRPNAGHVARTCPDIRRGQNFRNGQ
jgi:hypothetical protein